ncbi:synaptotagmin 12 isoform X2 [Leptinotarsa decemlineata]
MSSVSLAIIILCIIAVLLIIFFVFFHTIDFFGWIQTWIQSNKEEKASLTKLKGHYNANGYLVHSDSDIQLNWSTGSFKRFDSVDRDFRINLATTSLTDDRDSSQSERVVSLPTARSIPVITDEELIQMKRISPEECRSSEKTSISPIPRPVSSVNMATLISQSSFPVCITPPPSPSCPQGPALGTNQPQLSHNPPLKLCGVYIHPGQQGPLPQQPLVPPPASEEVEVIHSSLKRAISCDSVCSDTSVALGDLEMLNITGYLCIGLEYDSECWDLVVNVLEAKDLSGVVKKDDTLDTYVRVSLLPDKEATIQTRVYRSSGSPSYKERFLFSMNPREQSQRLLYFHVYATDFLTHTLVGEGEIRLSEISLRQPVTTWVTLTDTGQKGTEFGELMFSLSYLPTAERLTVVVVKARNLRFSTESPGEAFVKVYLMQQNKKINKKKTSVKKGDKCPIFNEAMMFSVPAHTLSTIQLRLTVAECSTEENPKTFPIGHVIVGAQASGRSLSHWNQMLTALRKPVAMWHSLRK